MTPVPFLRVGFLILAIGLGITVATSLVTGAFTVPAAVAVFAATCLAGEGLMRLAARRGALR